MLLEHSPIIVNILKYLPFTDCCKPICKKWIEIHRASDEFNLLKKVRDSSINDAFITSCEQGNIKMMTFFVYLQSIQEKKERKRRKILRKEEKRRRKEQKILRKEEKKRRKREKKKIKEEKKNIVSDIASNIDWDEALCRIVDEGHHVKLIDFFIGRELSFGGVLQIAIEKNRMDVIKRLVELGADDWSYGFECACDSQNKEMIDFFIEKGADDWNTGLLSSITHNNRDLIDFFIEKGADNWNSALEASCRENNEDLVKFFIERGASPNKNVLKIALKYSSENIIRILHAYKKDIRIL